MATRKAYRTMPWRDVQRLFPEMPKKSQIKTFYAAMGRTIGAWQIVEYELYEIYRACTRANRPGAEAAAFYSVPAFRAKLNMASAAVEFACLGHEALWKEWTTLRNRTDKKADRRNEIAHGAVWTKFHEPRRDRKIYIGPNMMDIRQDIRRKPGQDAEPLTLKRLRGYEKDFRDLADSLRNFAQRIHPLPTPP